MEELNYFLNLIVMSAHHCAHCIYNHNGTCFFAYECILNEFMHYTEEEESQ